MCKYLGCTVMFLMSTSDQQDSQKYQSASNTLIPVWKRWIWLNNVFWTTAYVHHDWETKEPIEMQSFQKT